jgi:O-antigen ligase
VSLEPGRYPRAAAAAEVRVTARRTADAWRSSGVGVALLGIGVAVFFMLAFIVLDYTFDQQPHRIFKVALGLLALMAIMARPRTGLLLLPVVTPFLPWVPPTPIPGLNALNVLLLAIFGAFAFGRVMAHQQLFRAGHLGKVIGGLLLLCALGIVRGAAFPTGYSFDAYFAGLNLFRSATTFATYFIVMAMVDGEKDRRRVLWAVLLSLVLEALVTLKLGRSGSGGRAVGSIGQANELGTFFALTTVLAFAMLPAIRNWFGRLLLLGTFALGATGLVYSVSRAGMLSFAVAMLLVAARSSRWLLALFVVGLLTGPMWAPDYVKDRISGSRVEVEGTDEAQLDRASEARIVTWQSAMQVVKDHPLDGVGFTGLAAMLPDVGDALGLADVRDSTHNTYLRMMAEEGIIGLLVFVWLMLRCLWLGELGVRLARTRFDRAMAVGVQGACVVMMVSCAFGDRFFNVVIASGFWVVCALVEDAIKPRVEPA